VIHIQRLGQKVVCPGLQRCNGPVHGAVCADHQRCRRGMALSYGAQQYQAVGTWQLQVGHDQVGIELIQNLQGLLGTLDMAYPITFCLKLLEQQLAQGEIVLNHQHTVDLLAHERSCSRLSAKRLPPRVVLAPTCNPAWCSSATPLTMASPSPVPLPSLPRV
jgi:hypothetical protein